MSAFDCAHVEVEDFLECLEIRNVSMATEEEYLFSCPFPGHKDGDEKPSAYMNAETTAWFCHGCHKKGNAITFTASLLEISPIKAIMMLRERYQPGFINPEAVDIMDVLAKILNPPEPDPVNVPIDEALVERFAMDWPAAFCEWSETQHHTTPWGYMFNRGFEPETLEHWEFGWDERSNRITFAVRNESGDLIGFKGRACEAGRQPKYMFLGDKPGKSRYGFPIPQSSQFVFGLHEAKLHGPRLVLCEGELNAIALWQMGIRNACAVNGSNFSSRHAYLIRKYADSVVVFFDTDTSGNDGTRMVREALRDFLPVWVVPPHEGDPAEMDDDQAKALIDAAEPDIMLALRGQ